MTAAGRRPAAGYDESSAEPLGPAAPHHATTGRVIIDNHGPGQPKILVGWATVHVAPPIIDPYVR